MKNRIKKITSLLLFILSVILIQDFCQKRTQGFTLAKAKSSDTTTTPLLLLEEEKKSIEQMLNQPFYFMKKGLQSYAFLSEDGNYVLKLLRWKELEPSWLIKHLPFSWARQRVERKKQKKEHDFTSYQLALEELKEETGLIYLHLQKTQGLDSSLHLYDAIKVKHIVPADRIEFILQKKADLFLPYFEAHQEDEEKMKLFFSRLAFMIKQRVERKISDSDISLEYNMGVLGETPVLFDIGNLTKVEHHVSFDQLAHEESRLVLSYLREKAPELALYLEKELKTPSPL